MIYAACQVGSQEVHRCAGNFLVYSGMSLTKFRTISKFSADSSRARLKLILLSGTKSTFAEFRFSNW